MPGLPESSTASVAKMSSVFVFGPVSATWCASQLRPPLDECATQTWWKFSACVMLQPWVVFATGSAGIHWADTPPLSGGVSLSLGVVLAKDCTSPFGSFAEDVGV